MVRERAALTPFAFNEMATAAASLLPAAKASGKGLEELISYAEILAASNPAEGLEGAAFSLKEALSGDFTSIIERFNLPRQRLNELKDEGVPALEAVQIAMSELGLDAELVTGLAGTLEGRWSTFVDTLQNLAATVTQPIFDKLSSGLGDIQVLLDANAPAMQAIADLLAGTFAGAINDAAGYVAAFTGSWQSSGASLMDTATQAFTYVAGIVNTVMPSILEVVQSVGVYLSEFWAQNGADIMATSQQVWTTITQIVQIAAEILAAIFSVIAGFINEHGATITAILTAAWEVIKNVITTAANLIKGILEVVLKLIQGDFDGAWDSIKATSAEFVKGLVGIIEAGASLLGAAIDLGIAAIEDAWDAFTGGAGSLGNDLIDGIVSGVSKGVGALKDAVTSAARAALDAAKSALGISSPSRVFSDSVGFPISQGMAAGIIQGMPLVTNAASMLTAGALAGATSYVGDTYHIDARGSTMSGSQLEDAVRRVQTRSSYDAYSRRRMA